MCKAKWFVGIFLVIVLIGTPVNAATFDEIPHFFLKIQKTMGTIISWCIDLLIDTEQHTLNATTCDQLTKTGGCIEPNG